MLGLPVQDLDNPMLRDIVRVEVGLQPQNLSAKIQEPLLNEY